jgi:hypothetical protein
MAHDVFISYSSKDKSTADAACATLENRKIRCWIAPRDVPPGIPYAAALVSAISQSKVFVLVLSEGSNSSGAVMREVEEAVDNGIPIIPLRIEEMEPTEAMRYYIKSIHWIDAMSPPLEKHLERLADSVQAIMNVGDDARAAPADRTFAPAPASARRRLPIWAIGLLAIAGIALMGGVGAMFLSRGGPAGDEPLAGSELPATTLETPPEAAGEVQTPVAAEATPTAEMGEGWQPLSFMIPAPQLWKETQGGRYTAAGNQSVDSFAWSTESFEGSLAVHLTLASPKDKSEGCIILYGDGRGYSYGSLIFCVESEFYQLEKHTREHEGENFLAYAPSNIEFGDQTYQVEVNVLGDVASMYVNGAKVLSTFFDPDEIHRQGRIGLNKVWIGNEITFSDVRVKLLEEEAQESTPAGVDETDCGVDTGTPVDYSPMESAVSSHPVEIDGEITSPEEWSDASCMDLRMHYSTNVTNPEFQRARWWVKNDDQNVYFLVRVPGELAARGVFMDYFWPEYTGSWAHSDGVFIDREGQVFDHGNWDELQWHEDADMDPPGTIDVQGAHKGDGEFDWFEISRPLDSGDANDWALKTGQTVGNHPRDSFLVGIVLEQGEYMRYLQLKLADY